MTTAESTVIVLDSDDEDDENRGPCAQVVVHKARKSITEKADACQRVLVQLTREYTVSSFFEPRKKTRCQTSVVSPVVIDDEGHEDEKKKEEEEHHLSGHTRQLSGDEMSSLQKLLNMREKVLVRMKETNDWDKTWKEMLAEVDGVTGDRNPMISDNTAIRQRRTNVEQSSETVSALNCDDVSNALASIRIDFNEITIRDIVNEVLKEYERHRQDQQQMLWSEKYRPHKGRFLCIANQTTEQFGTWLSEWADIVNQEGTEIPSDEKSVPKKEKNGQTTPRLCVVYGHGSCGKTAMVYTCAEEHGMEVMEMNASECRSGQTVLKRIAESVGTQRIGTETSAEQTNSSKAKKRSRRRVILFDDADVALSEDKGFYSAIAKLAESSDYPIVLTCRHRTQKIMKLSQGALFIHISIPEYPDIALHATAIAIAELFGLSTDAPKSVQTRSIVSNMFHCFSTASQMIPAQTGLKGILLWAQMNIRDVKSLQQCIDCDTVSCHVVGLSSRAASWDSLEADLETCHLQGIDSGFDSWPSWCGGSCEDEFVRASSLFSDLDVLDSCSWSTPEGTLPFWHRASLTSTIFETQILNSYHASSRPWVLDCSFSIPPSSLSLNRAEATKRYELPLQVPRPRQLAGMRSCDSLSTWVFITTLLSRSASSTCAWGTEILPALRRIVKSEAIREQKKRRRFFFHHLAHFTAHDLEDVAQSSLGCGGT